MAGNGIIYATLLSTFLRPLHRDTNLRRGGFCGVTLILRRLNPRGLEWLLKADLRMHLQSAAVPWFSGLNSKLCYLSMEGLSVIVRQNKQQTILWEGN